MSRAGIHRNISKWKEGIAKTLTVFQGVKEQVRHLKTSILDRAEVCSQLPRESVAKIAPS